MRPGLRPVAADPDTFLAAQVEGAGVRWIDHQGADVALDEHAALAGTGEGPAVVGAVEDALADGADEEMMGFHGASGVGFCLQGRSSRREQPGGNSASSGSMQGMPSRMKYFSR